MDIDKSGRIEFDEFKKALKEHASKHDADELIEQLKKVQPELEAANAQVKLYADMLNVFSGVADTASTATAEGSGEVMCNQQ